MSSPCTRCPLAGCRRRAASCHSSLSPSRLRGLLRVALGLACLLAFTLPGIAARPGADGSLNVISSRAATRTSAMRDTTTARGKELLLSKMERQSNRGKKPKPTEPVPTEPAPTEPEPTEPTPTEPEPTPTEPEPTEPEPTEPPPAGTQPERTPITHGLEVGPATVGLAGGGVTYSKLTLVSGGKASTLVNGTDPETGRPMLSLLDIAGQLTIDVPCVIDRCRVTQVGGLYGVRNSPMVDFEARDSEFEALPGPDGKVKYVRYSACRDPKIRAEPEGLIDPYVHLLSFWNGERPRHPDAPQLEGTGEIRLESVDRASGYWITRSATDPSLHARTSGVYLRAAEEDVEIMDGSDPSRRAELIATKLQEWQAIANS